MKKAIPNGFFQTLKFLRAPFLDREYLSAISLIFTLYIKNIFYEGKNIMKKEKLDNEDNLMDKSYLEQHLPHYLQKDIDALKKGNE